MPRRPEQFEELREKSREKILSASLELFANKGYDATSIESIATKAGISKGLIYNYYESKKSILLAIFEDAIAQGESMIEKQKGAGSVQHRVEGMIEMYFDLLQGSPEYLKLLMVISLQPGVMEDTKELTGEMFKRNQEMIAAVFNKGKDKDPLKGLMLDALLDGILLNYIRYGNKYPIDALKKRIIKDYCTPEKK
jgi:AcrR family transcriptional regulator